MNSLDQLLTFFALQDMRSKRIELFDTLSACLKGGSAVQDTLDVLGELTKEQGDMSKMRIYRAISDDVRNSPDLALGLARIADQDDKMVLAISPDAVDLAALVSSVSQMAKMRKLITKAAFNGALIYGLFLTVAGTVAYAMGGTGIVPQLLRQLPVSKHPAASVIEAAFGQFAQSWWPLITMLVTALVIFVGWSLARLTGPLRDLLDKFPVYASYKAMAAGNFLVTLAILYKNKVGTTGALDMIQANSNPYIAYQVRKMFALQQEQTSSDELSMLNTGFVDQDLLAMIRVVGRNRSPAEAVAQIALGQTDQLLSKISAASSVASSVLLLIGGFMIAATVIGTLGILPIMMENFSSPGQR